MLLITALWITLVMYIDESIQNSSLRIWRMRHLWDLDVDGRLILNPSQRNRLWNEKQGPNGLIWRWEWTLGSKNCGVLRTCEQVLVSSEVLLTHEVSYL